VTNEERDHLLTRLDERTQRIEHDLFGNGQPGILACLRQDISALQEHASQGKGALLVMGFLLTVFGGSELIKALF